MDTHTYAHVCAYVVSLDIFLPGDYILYVLMRFIIYNNFKLQHGACNTSINTMQPPVYSEPQSRHYLKHWAVRKHSFSFFSSVGSAFILCKEILFKLEYGSFQIPGFSALSFVGGNFSFQLLRQHRCLCQREKFWHSAKHLRKFRIENFHSKLLIN